MSTFFSSFSDTHIAYVLFFGLILVLILLLVKIALVEKKLKKILIGKNAEDIGASLSHLAGEVKNLQAHSAKVDAYLSRAEKRLSRSVQAVETVRFNPFKGMGEGGSQSFSTALLSEEGNGVVISGLYSRDRISIFSKPIAKNISEHSLTEEEEAVLTRAQEKVKK